MIEIVLGGMENYSLSVISPIFFIFNSIANAVIISPQTPTVIL